MGVARLTADVPVEIASPRQGDADSAGHWFDAPEGRVHEGAFAHARRLEDAQSERRAMRLKTARLYGNKDFLSFFGDGYARTHHVSRNDRIGLNVCKSCVDTAAAKISKNKPRALFLTEDGDYQLQDKAKNLTEFCDGMFEIAKAYPTAQRAFVDSLVFDAGGWKVCVDPDTDEIRWDRVFIDDLRIDEVEARDGELLQLHHVRAMSATKLRAQIKRGDYGADEARKRELLSAVDAQSGLGIVGGSTTRRTGQVRVIESWRVAIGDAPGRHTMTIEGADLLDEPWKFPWVPFVFLFWTPALIGFLGQGLVEELIGIQLEINKLLRTIQEAMHLACVPRVFLDTATEVMREIDNEVGGHYRYAGRPPIISTAPAMPGEVYQHLENLYRKAFEITGISMLSATSKKPAGLDAAVALREYQDIETERFILQGQRFENAFMEGTRKSLSLLRERVKDGSKAIKVKGRDGQYIKNLDLAEIDLEETQYELRCWPVSFLPSTPAGKLQAIKELVKDGFIQDRSEAMSLLDFPDIKSFVSLQTAALDDVKMMISAILDRGDYIAPDKYTNLALAQKLARSTLLRARAQKRPQETIDLLQQFEDEVVALLEGPAAPPAATGPTAPGGPGGPAGPPGGGGAPAPQLVPMGGPTPVAAPPLVPQMEQPVMGEAA